MVRLQKYASFNVFKDTLSFPWTLILNLLYLEDLVYHYLLDDVFFQLQNANTI